MPRKLSRRQRLLAGIGGALCALVMTPGAALAAECPVTESKPVFAQFGDGNHYVLAPGGDFEALTWRTFGRVGLADVNDPFYLAPGESSLSLDRSGEMVTSHSFCVDRTMPHMRFVGKGWGQLDVIVEVRLPGGSTDSSSGSVSPDSHRHWAPSRYIDLKTGSIPAGQSATAKVTFKSNGSWLIDNLFLDPYRR